MYDYGSTCPGDKPKPFQETCNQAKYGQDSPPTYDLGQVTTKAAVFEGDADVMATKPDVAKLRKTWRAKVVYDYNFPKTAHMVGVD